MFLFVAQFCSGRAIQSGRRAEGPRPHVWKNLQSWRKPSRLFGGHEKSLYQNMSLNSSGEDEGNADGRRQKRKLNLIEAKCRVRASGACTNTPGWRSRRRAGCAAGEKIQEVGFQSTAESVSAHAVRSGQMSERRTKNMPVKQVLLMQAHQLPTTYQPQIGKCFYFLHATESKQVVGVLLVCSALVCEAQKRTEDLSRKARR